jgi:predicted nucleotidyltransferase
VSGVKKSGETGSRLRFMPQGKAALSFMRGFLSFRPMTKPSSALEVHRNDVRRIIAANHAANPRVFGSVLHGEDDDGSDLDILVDALQGATLFDLGAIQVELEELLGVPVDVVTPQDLPMKFRSVVLSEARAV